MVQGRAGAQVLVLREPCLWVGGGLVLPPGDAQSHFLNEAWLGPLTWVAPAIFDSSDALPTGCGEVGHPSLGFSVPA